MGVGIQPDDTCIGMLLQQRIALFSGQGREREREQLGGVAVVHANDGEVDHRVGV